MTRKPRISWIRTRSSSPLTGSSLRVSGIEVAHVAHAGAGWFWTCPERGDIDARNTAEFPVQTRERAERWCEAYVRDRLCLPDNDAHLLDLIAEIRDGSSVYVLEDLGAITRTVARSNPWRLASNHWSVLLEGRAGGFLFHRCALAMEVTS